MRNSPYLRPFLTICDRVPRLLELALLVLLVSPFVAAQENLPDLVSRIKPSVVALVTYDEKGHELAQGSGFFTAPNRVITNLHPGWARLSAV